MTITAIISISAALVSVAAIILSIIAISKTSVKKPVKKIRKIKKAKKIQKVSVPQKPSSKDKPSKKIFSDEEQKAKRLARAKARRQAAKTTKPDNNEHKEVHNGNHD